MPTILERLRIEIPPVVQGRSLLPLARGERLDLVALSESWYPRHHYGWSELTAIRDGRYQFIAAPRRELYDTQTDPGETHNLAASNPGRADALDRALQDFVARTSAHRAPAAPRPWIPRSRNGFGPSDTSARASARGRSRSTARRPKDRSLLTTC
jgi:arylsulfatase A-like enzyme